MATVNAPTGRRFRGKVPEQHPRHNNGPSKGVGREHGVAGGAGKKPSSDLGWAQLYLADDSPVNLPMAMTDKAQPDFPVCLGCLKEYKIVQDTPGAERKILCPKSLVRLKTGEGDWMPVPAHLAVLCDGHGSAAAIAEREARAQDNEQRA